MTHIQAVFIDRDGTIGGNDQVIYPGEFTLFPNVLKTIQLLKSSGILVCSFTNQPGISKGESTLSIREGTQGFWVRCNLYVPSCT